MRWILLLAILAGTPSFAQDYFEDDPRWKIRRGCYGGGCIYADNYEYSLSGDSVINGVLWHRVVRQGVVDLTWIKDPPADPTCQGSTPYGTEAYAPIWVRQEGRTMRILSINTDRLLHDFDLVVGQAITVGYAGGYSGHVTAVDSILIGSTMRARYTTSIWQMQLIEGVGSNRGLVESYQSWDECGTTITCYSVDGYGYYPAPGEDCALPTSVASSDIGAFQMWPNPAENVLNLSNDVTLGLVEIHDARGGLARSSTLNSTNTTSLDLTGLSNGIYSVRVGNRPAQRLMVIH